MRRERSYDPGLSTWDVPGNLSLLWGFRIAYFPSP